MQRVDSCVDWRAVYHVLASAGNFQNLEKYTASGVDMIYAMDLAEGAHLKFNQRRLDETCTEVVWAGSNRAVDQLFAAGTLPADAVVEVHWAKALHLSASLVVRKGARVLLTAAGADYIVELRLLFSVADTIFLFGPCIPMSNVTVDAVYSSWAVSKAVLRSSPICSIPLHQVACISLLHLFNAGDDGDAHFIKV